MVACSVQFGGFDCLQVCILSDVLHLKYNTFLRKCKWNLQKYGQILGFVYKCVDFGVWSDKWWREK